MGTIRLLTPDAVLVLLAVASAASAETVAVPNPSFEDGKDAPDGWTLSGSGAWAAEEAPHGRRCVVARGTGEDSGEWASAPLPWTPGAIYRLRFRARSLGARGGTPVSGPAFCNRDLGDIPEAWTAHLSYFAAPSQLDPGAARLRFGQWRVNGAVAFDQVDLAPAVPVYARQGRLALGEGEELDGNDYAFDAPHDGVSRNHSRPLAGANARFNTNRWVLGEGSFVEYRHALAGRKWTALELRVSVTWYAAGELLVSARLPGTEWTALGRLAKTGSGAWRLPAEGLPAGAVGVRLEGRGKGCSLQVGAYGCRGRVDGAPASLVGSTQFVAVLAEDPAVRVEVRGLPHAARLARRVDLRVRNVSDRPISFGLSDFGPVPWRSYGPLAPGKSRTIAMPVSVGEPGHHVVPLELPGGHAWKAELEWDVSTLHDENYGEALPGPAESGLLWWAPSGHRVSRARSILLKSRGDAVRIEAARNETEAAQVVLRPWADLAGVRVEADPLAGPGGAVIPAARVEVLQVAYVDIRLPSDAAGSADPWPDPLLPISGPLDLPGGRHHPFWIRVSVPRGVPAGTYTGAVRFSWPGGRPVAAPLAVRVFDFDLPDDTTCSTAFGFDPSLVWRYHGLTDEVQKREVLEKYWRSFASHRISPYDPAPLDPPRVRWTGGDAWQGGERDSAVKFAGTASRKVADGDTMAQVSASYAEEVPIPPKGLRLRLRHRAAAHGQKFIVTLSHRDAAGRWMSGRNNDIAIEGTAEWREFERSIDAFPSGATSVTLHLWAAEWRDDGSTTGTVWFDDVSLADAETGRELLRDGGFEDEPGRAATPEFDGSAWEAETARVLAAHRFNSFMARVEGMGGGTWANRAEPELLGFREGTPQYRQMFAAYAKGLETRLREKGWLDKAYVYWFDEPEPRDYEFVMAGFRRLKEAAPGLRRMLTEQPEEALAGGPNLWCPITAAYDRAACDARLRAGEAVWWYVCTGPKAPYAGLFVDHPATDLRVWLWQTWERGISGILVWQTNYWTSDAAYPDRPQNPWTDPMSWQSGFGTAPGTRLPWGNGDGRFLYPPLAAASGRPASPVLDGPVESVRWVMLRDGIEDYEYLAMLKGLLAEKGSRVPAARRAEIEVLLEVPPEVSRSLTGFTRDPAPIGRRRRELAEAIESLREK